MTVLMGERLGSGAHRSGIEPLLDYAAATSDGHGGTMLDDRAVRLQFAAALAAAQGERFFPERLRTHGSGGANPGAPEPRRAARWDSGWPDGEYEVGAES